MSIIDIIKNGSPSNRTDAQNLRLLIALNYRPDWIASLPPEWYKAADIDSFVGHLRLVQFVSEFIVAELKCRPRDALNMDVLKSIYFKDCDVDKILEGICRDIQTIKKMYPFAELFPEFVVEGILRPRLRGYYPMVCQYVFNTEGILPVSYMLDTRPFDRRCYFFRTFGGFVIIELTYENFYINGIVAGIPVHASRNELIFAEKPLKNIPGGINMMVSMVGSAADICEKFYSLGRPFAWYIEFKLAGFEYIGEFSDTRPIVTAPIPGRLSDSRKFADCIIHQNL